MTDEEAARIALKALDVEEDYGITSFETSLVKKGYQAAMAEVRVESVKYFGGIAISHQWFPLAGWLDLLDAKLKEQP